MSLRWALLFTVVTSLFALHLHECDSPARGRSTHFHGRSPFMTQSLAYTTADSRRLALSRITLLPFPMTSSV
jgi:hypothetical protein